LEAYEKNHFTPKEIEASNIRTSKMCKKINIRIAAEDISKQTALESATGKTPDSKSLRKVQGK